MHRDAMAGPVADAPSVSIVADESGALPDGVYDVFVVDADDADGGTSLDLTITSGEFKGQVLSVASATSLGDPIELLGMPATLTIAFGAPSVTIDR